MFELIYYRLGLKRRCYVNIFPTLPTFKTRGITKQDSGPRPRATVVNEHAQYHRISSVALQIFQNKTPSLIDVFLCHANFYQFYQVFTMNKIHFIYFVYYKFCMH